MTSKIPTYARILGQQHTPQICAEGETLTLDEAATWYVRNSPQAQHIAKTQQTVAIELIRELEHGHEMHCTATVEYQPETFRLIGMTPGLG